MSRRRQKSILVLCSLALPLACTDANRSSVASGASSAATAPAGASPAATISEVDGSDPWGGLGDLTGHYWATAERLASSCKYGPDVPWSNGSGYPYAFEATPPPFSTSYSISLVERGESILFEMAEGLVFARHDGAGRLLDVVRVAAEGVTRYHDGFAVEQTEQGFSIEGESRWTFYDDYWEPGAVCEGRTSWAMRGGGDTPGGGPRDVHFVLRWPVESNSDLDLLVEAPRDTFGDRHRRSESRAYLGEVQNNCYLLHSAGTAGAAPSSRIVDWVHPIEETTLDYHEEIVRCSNGSYGGWVITVANWSVEGVEYEIEAFEGPTLGVNPARERWLDLIAHSVPGLSSRSVLLEYVPPEHHPSHGAVLTGGGTPPRQRAQRPYDSITDSRLGFNKAAALDVSYREFRERIFGIEVEDPLCPHLGACAAPIAPNIGSGRPYFP